MTLHPPAPGCGAMDTETNDGEYLTRLVTHRLASLALLLARESELHPCSAS